MKPDDSTAAAIPAPHPISIEFFSKQTNKTTQLVENGDNFSVEGTHRWYDFTFLEPVYLSNLKIECSGYESWHKFEVEVFHSDQSVHQDAVSVDNSLVSLDVGKLTLGFRFRPASRWAAKTAILNVVANGYTLNEFHEIEWSLKDIWTREARLLKKEERIAELDEAASEKSKNLKQLSSEVGKLTAQKAELDESIASLEQKWLDAEASQKDILNDIQDLQSERRKIKSEISSDEAQLNKLTTKLRLFPSEIAGFVEEGGRNIRNYLLLSIPFAGILAIVLVSLFSSSIDLTQLWRIDPDVNIWVIFLTRLPFVIVAITLIETCGFIVGRFIFEIVRINRQRLEFSKLSIIAKDVVTAVSASTEMSEEERFAEETKLKMALLQEHMKSQSREEYTYSGSPITAAVIGVASKIIGKPAA